MPQLRLSLFGPFRATIDGQPLASFPTDKVRALLAYLALEPDKPHRREVLASLLWPNWPEEDARRNLRQSLHRLKQTMDRAQPGLADRLLAATATGIQLDSAACRLDVAEFRRLLAEVENHRHRQLHACETCVARLIQAADLYAGEFLVGLSLPDAAPFEAWQTIQREALHYQAVTALQALAEAHGQRGAHGQAHATAMRLLAMEPWLEAAHRLAMRSLALSGQQSEALAHFDLCRRVLEEELGVEPAEETRTLYWQIAAGELPDAAASRNDRSDLHHFPAQFTRFVGRRAELAQILDALADPERRLVTLVGPGGIGKTRLAVEASYQATRLAADFLDGIYFIPLAEVASTDLLASALATGLGFALHDHRPLEQLVAYLRPKRLLLVLDNFEHLVGDGSGTDGSAWVATILRSTHDVQFLVTSQKPLDLRAEWRINVEGLDYPALGAVDAAVFDASSSVQLFLQSARRALAQPDFVPDDDERAAIVRICRLTQGMPLAIELAAAWVRASGCAAIAEELGQRLDLLATTLRDVPERHRSLRAAFDYAWRLLTADERAALARVSIFRGGFSRAAAQAVAGASLVDLTGLLDRSLLARAGRERFAVHPLVRQFGASKLGEMGLDRQLAADHLAYYSGWIAARAGAARTGPLQIQTLAEIEADIENLTAAWQWAVETGSDNALAAMQDGLFDFWTIRSRFQEGDLAFGQAAAALQTRPGDSVLRASMQARWAWFLFQRGEIQQSRRLLEDSAESLRMAGSLRERAWSLAYLGALLRHEGRYEPAQIVLEDALALAEQAGAEYHVGVTLNVLGQVYLLQRRLTEARDALERALAIKRRIGDRWGMTFSLSYLGRLAQAVGEHRQAGPLLRESLALSQEFGDRRGVAFALFNLGSSAEALGQAAEASELYGQSLRIYEEIGCRADALRVQERRDAAV